MNVELNQEERDALVVLLRQVGITHPHAQALASVYAKVKGQDEAQAPVDNPQQ